jgi:hypothetical protein
VPKLVILFYVLPTYKVRSASVKQPRETSLSKQLFSRGSPARSYIEMAPVQAIEQNETECPV